MSRAIRGIRDTAFKSGAVGVALQSAFGADNEAIDFTKIKLLDGQGNRTLTAGTENDLIKKKMEELANELPGD